jgi:hypothetical protein
MAEKNRKAKAGGPRTEVFAMRLDPKLKYLAEIAARKQRRSLANFIEWSLEKALDSVKLVESEDGPFGISVLDQANKLWDLEPSDRLIKLAENYPDLLNYEEQIIWKAIFDVTTIGTFVDPEGETQFMTYELVYEKDGNKRADRSSVKECWPELVGYADGTVSIEQLETALMKLMPF